LLNLEPLDTKDQDDGIRVAVTALEQSAARANVSVARAVDWLARNSFVVMNAAFPC
jgi:hypothetical protein